MLTSPFQLWRSHFEIRKSERKVHLFNRVLFNPSKESKVAPLPECCTLVRCYSSLPDCLFGTKGSNDSIVVWIVRHWFPLSYCVFFSVRFRISVLPKCFFSERRWRSWKQRELGMCNELLSHITDYTHTHTHAYRHTHTQTYRCTVRAHEGTHTILAPGGQFTSKPVLDGFDSYLGVTIGGYKV